MTLSSAQKKLLIIGGIACGLAFLSMLDDINDEFALYKNVINDHADAITNLQSQLYRNMRQ